MERQDIRPWMAVTVVVSTALPFHGFLYLDHARAVLDVVGLWQDRFPWLALIWPSLVVAGWLFKKFRRPSTIPADPAEYSQAVKLFLARTVEATEA